MLKLTGIHNFSSLSFSFRQLLLLSCGLKFIPTPSICLKSISIYKNELLHNFNNYRTSLERCFNVLDNCYENREVFVKKLHVKSNAGAPETNMYNSNIVFKNYIQFTNNLINKKINDPNLCDQLNRTIKSNISYENKKFISTLIDDRTITIKNTDKNLGISIVSTDWYNQQLTTMLSDILIYQFVTTIRYSSGTSALPVKAQTTIIADPIYKQIQGIMSRYQNILPLLPSSEQIMKYIKKKITVKTCRLPAIYLLIKVHKPILTGRPIVPSRFWITSPISVVLDFLLQPYVKNIPWLIKDTKHLINELEIRTIPTYQTNGLLVTADIASLYTNIDTTIGIQCIREFLEECKLNFGCIGFIIELLLIVMKNNYMHYNGKIYKQINGTAMGTSCAPTYANIIVYMLERKIISKFSLTIYVYFRYLDDIFLYINSLQYERIKKEFNCLNSKLKYEFVCDNYSIPYLDIVIYKGKRFETTNRFDTKVYQKKLNLYLYIPYHSFHTMNMKKSFIGTELIRYIRNTSSLIEFLKLRNLFYNRLIDRGYPRQFLNKIISNFNYQDRNFYLLPSVFSETVTIPHILANRIINTNINYIGWSRMAVCSNVTFNTLMCKKEKLIKKLIFITSFDPLNKLISIRQLLLKYFDMIIIIKGNSYEIPKPTIAYKSMNSMYQLLVNKKQNHYNKIRHIQSTTNQSTINKFFKLTC